MMEQVGQSYSMIHLQGCDLGWLCWNMARVLLMLLLDVWFALLIFWQKIFFELPCEISYQNETCVPTKYSLANVVCVYEYEQLSQKHIQNICLFSYVRKWNGVRFAFPVLLIPYLQTQNLLCQGLWGQADSFCTYGNFPCWILNEL